MAQLPKTITDSLVKKQEGKLTLKDHLEPHSVKLIELIPEYIRVSNKGIIFKASVEY
jgi:hypothetical protein